MSSKLQEFLLRCDRCVGDTAQVFIKGFPYPFLIRSISEAENKAIRKECQRVTLDKKTRQRLYETDADLYNNRLVAACCLEPNLKDAALQEKFGVCGAEMLLDSMLKPGQYTELLLAVQEINGFYDDIGELIDEAKNSSPVEETPSLSTHTSPSIG